jgi:hypothetical protein
MQASVIVLDDIAQAGEAAVVERSTLLVAPHPASGAVRYACVGDRSA